MKTQVKNRISILLVVATLISMAALSTARAQDLIPETVAQGADTTFPSDVENLQAEGGDGLVTLTWDAATDNVGVEGYNIYYGTTPVTADSGSYTEGPIDTGNVIEYDVTGLDNGTAYYFVVTAYDAAGNESEYYSLEASATPEADDVAPADAGDTLAPRVVNAVANNRNEVRVQFSEGVVLPTTSPASAFSIQDDVTSTPLEVVDAVADEMDPTGRTVILTTADQAVGTTYVLTAGIQIADESGNPIISGTSDTAIFAGSSLPSEDLNAAAEEEEGDTQGPEFVSVNAVNDNTVEVTFSEPVVLSADARDNFIITDELDNTQILEVKTVSIGATGMVVSIETEAMQEKSYNLIALQIADVVGNEMDVEASATTFMGMGAAVEEEVVEEEVMEEEVVEEEVMEDMLEEAASDLMANILEDLVVQLTWKTKEEKVAEIANFVLYMSTDKGATYGEGVELGTDVTSYDFTDLQEDMVYYFKLTSRDLEGNETEGLETFVTLKLPATGPGLAILLLGSAGAGAVLSRKKKK